MNRFRYTAYDRAGVRQESDMEAPDEMTALARLKEQGLVPIGISPVTDGAETAGSFSLFKFRKKPNASEIEFMTSQLVILLKNGIKIDRAIETASRSVTNPALKKIVNTLYERVRSGHPLAAALRDYPELFTPLYVSVVAIGEATGRLADAFSELSANLAFHREVASKTRQALIYPGVIFIVCVLSVVFLFNFVVPRFETLFSRMSHPPLATQLLLQISWFFKKTQWAMLVGAFFVPVLIRRLIRNPVFRSFSDGVMLRLPISRRLVYTLENLRFASSMSILLHNGVLLVDALDYAVQSIGNHRIRKRLLSVRNEVKQGQRLSESMNRTGFLPDIYSGVLEVGEQAGNLVDVFRDMEQRTRVFYEQSLTGLITLIEPVMIVVMGGIVGSIVVIMLLSIVSLQQIPFK